MHTNPGVLLGAGHIPVPALGLGLVQQPVRIPVQLFHRPGLFHQQDPTLQESRLAPEGGSTSRTLS